MARDGGTHGDFRGLAISDLTDHYYVGILPKDGTESHWKGQSGERAHLDLIDAGELVLHRILERDHVEPLLV